MPTAASAIPPGSSHGSERPSERWPKRGWTTDDDTVAASTSADACPYDQPCAAIRNGRSAGSAPWHRSTHRWPSDRYAMARRSKEREVGTSSTGSRCLHAQPSVCRMVDACHFSHRPCKRLHTYAVPPGGPVTLRDVARAARVHPGTVSRALNAETRGLVNEETAERVLRAAQELGYRPNPIARGLKTNRSFTVGVLVPDLTNPLFPPIVRGIEDRLGAAGYTSLIANTDNDPDRERQDFDAMRARQVDGFITATARLHV